MSTSDLQSTIFFGDARAESLTNEITDNSMDLRLAQNKPAIKSIWFMQIMLLKKKQ